MSTSLSPTDMENGISSPPAVARLLPVLLPALAAGVLLAAVVLPMWLPGLYASLAGAEPKAYWYVSRAGAIAAYLLLWLSMALGLAITNKLARVWPGGPTVFDLHQYSSTLGLGFALVHALVLLGDRYVGYTLAQVLVPFAGTGYRPLWVGLGQAGLYLLAVVLLSFPVRRFTGNKVWRAIHFLSFAVFALALVHGITSGTDSGSLWMVGIYWATGGCLLFLTIYRILAKKVRIMKSEL